MVQVYRPILAPRIIGEGQAGEFARLPQMEKRHYYLLAHPKKAPQPAWLPPIIQADPHVCPLHRPDLIQDGANLVDSMDFLFRFVPLYEVVMVLGQCCAPVAKSKTKDFPFSRFVPPRNPGCGPQTTTALAMVASAR